jgi:DNA-binding IclR family transcriptional regulator
MIQVIERVGKIIDVLAENTKGCFLIDIEAATQLNKGTLCNLLKSLIEIGYVKKSRNGMYKLGEKLCKLAYPYFLSDNLIAIANQYAKRISQKTQESGLAVIRQEDELNIIARHIYDQNIVINSQTFGSLPGYNTAVGYIFLAFDKTIDCKKKFSDYFAAEYYSINDFMGIIEDIRLRKYHVFEIPGRQAYAIAVPVFQGLKIVMVLCTVIPDFRLNSEKKIRIIEVLKQTANDISEELTSNFKQIKKSII